MKSIVILCLKSGADPPLRPPRIAWLEGIVASDRQQRNGWIYLWGCIIANPPKLTDALFMTIEKVGGPVKNLGIPIKLLYRVWNSKKWSKTHFWYGEVCKVFTVLYFIVDSLYMYLFTGMNPKVWGQSPPQVETFCVSKTFDTFTRTSVYVSKMNAVACAQLTLNVRGPS